MEITQEQFNGLIKRISDVEYKQQNFVLKWPMPDESQKSIELAFDKFGLNKIMDLTWRKTFHWLTFFEALNGYNQSAVSGTISVTGTGISIATAAATGIPAYILKNPAYAGILSYNLPTFFRTEVNLSQFSNVLAFVGAGQRINATGDKYFGFVINGSNISGVSSNNGTNNEVAVLFTTTASGTPKLEARFYPQLNKIIFFINPTTTSPDPVGSIGNSANLPTGTPTAMFHLQVQTTVATSRTLNASYFEYMQGLNYIPLN